jgi:hypothetical protein
MGVLEREEWRAWATEGPAEGCGSRYRPLCAAQASSCSLSSCFWLFYREEGVARELTVAAGHAESPVPVSVTLTSPKGPQSQDTKSLLGNP